MKPTDLEKRMRAGECFHALKLLPGAWTVIRVDGRSFTRFTQSRFEKPYDVKFRDHMIAVCSALMREMNGIYAFTESDEASILFPPSWEMFDREHEKTVSVSAGIASSAFTLSCGESAHMDSRIWLGSDLNSVVDYFLWRHLDAARCCLNGWCYWTLRNGGKTYREASRELEGKSTAWKNEMLFQHGINFNDIPSWQKRGVGLYWESRNVEGYDPAKGVRTVAVRRRLKTDLDLPMKDQYQDFVRRLALGTQA